MGTYLPKTCREVEINILRSSVHLVGFIWKKLYRDARSTKHTFVMTFVTNIAMVTSVTKVAIVPAVLQEFKASAVVYLRPLLFWVCTQHRLVVGYWHLGTTCQSYATWHSRRVKAIPIAAMLCLTTNVTTDFKATIFTKVTNVLLLLWLCKCTKKVLLYRHFLSVQFLTYIIMQETI